MTDVFISYSRKDTEFVRRLVTSLEALGRDVWVDFDDIPFATDWWEEIVNGIEESNVAVFVISEDSLRSQVCSLELAHIFKINKRLIPIVARDDKSAYGDGNQSLIAPRKIMALNWIFFTDPEKYDESFAKLTETMETDVVQERASTQLLVRAREWERSGRKSEFFLNGQQIEEFTGVLDETKLTSLQAEFFILSRAHNHFLQIVRRFAWGFFAGAMGMVYFIVATFRGDSLIQPLTLALAIAAGEIFGVFVGTLAVLSYGLPNQLERIVPKPLHVGFRVVSAFSIGVLTWVVYQWFFLGIEFGLTYGAAIGGVGLAFGFVLAMFVNLKSWAIFLITWLTTFVPIYFLNNLSPLELIQNGSLNPLLYFDNPAHPMTVGLPLAFLIALGSIKPDAVIARVRWAHEIVWNRAILGIYQRISRSPEPIKE